MNAISVYRQAQEDNLEIAKQTFFTPPLKADNEEMSLTPPHILSIYIIPTYVQGDEREAAEEFLLYLAEQYEFVIWSSKLYNLPAWTGHTNKKPWVRRWFREDPYGPEAPTLNLEQMEVSKELIEKIQTDLELWDRQIRKLEILENAEDWTRHLGYPGPTNAAVMEVYNTNILTKMMRLVAQGEMTPNEAAACAERDIINIFNHWRNLGLIGGVNETPTEPECSKWDGEKSS